MKKSLYTIIIAGLFASILFYFTKEAFATTPTPTQTLNSQVEQQVNQLKDKIASKVAQLKLVEKRGIIGTVTATTNTQITVTDIHGATRDIDVDELTNFSSPTANGSFGISDLKNGTKIGIAGLFNKETKRILGRYISVLDFPVSFHGAIYDIDSKNFNAQAIDKNGHKMTIDIESASKIETYDASSGLTKAKFGAIQIGQHIIATGYLDTKDKSKLVTATLMLFPSIPKDPQIALPTPGTSNITPSTGNGNKLTPLKPISK